MPKILKLLNVLVRFNGLGFPKGYRPHSTTAEFPMQRVKWQLHIETLAEHQRRFHHAEAYEDQCLKPGEYQELGEDGFGNESFDFIVSAEELDQDHVKSAVRTFLGLKDIIVQEMNFRSPSPEDDMRLWKRERDHKLEWLRKGAPPFEMTILNDFVENIGELIEGIGSEQADMLLSNRGYERNENGLYVKNPPVTSEEPREKYEVALRTLADIVEDKGPLYLALGSWPTGTEFVAAGKRYMREYERDRRVWYGYLGSTQQVVIFKAPLQHELIAVSDAPDFLPALDIIER